MSESEQIGKLAMEGRELMLRAQARKLVEEGKAMLETDLRGGLGRMRQALALVPDFPELEDEIFLREDALEKLDSLLNYTVVLLKERKDYQACQLLRDLPDNYIIEDKAQMLGDLSARIGKAEALIEEARVLPKSANSPALKILEEALELVPDYPGLQDEIAAVRGAYSRYQVYLNSIEEAINGGNFDKAEELLKAFREAYQNDANVGRFEAAVVAKRRTLLARRKLKKGLRTVGMTAALAWIVGGGYYVYENWVLNRAAGDWSKVVQLLEQKKFLEVQESGGAVISKLNRVRFFGGDRKDDLLAKVDQVLQSEAVKQGALGRVLADGAYVPLADAEKVKRIKSLLDEGSGLSNAADYPGAVAKFEEGLKLLGGLEAGLVAKYGDKLKTSLRTAQEGDVRQKIKDSRTMKGAGDFDGAVARINEASQLAARYGLPPEVTMPAAEGAYHEVELGRYREMVAKGDKQLTAGRFTEAITAYEGALAFAQAQKLSSTTAAQGKVQESIAQAKVALLGAKGDNFVKRSRWVEAVNSYGSALKLHETSGLKKDLPIYRQVSESLIKAKRVAAVEEGRISEREAQKYFAAGEWVKAKNAYEREIALVDKGAYAADPEFAALRKNAVARQPEVDEKLFLAGKRDYLIERHRVLLKQAFGLSGEVALLDPAAVLLASEGDTLTYSLTARSFEGRGGSGVYTLYEVIYAFNRKSGGWTLLDKKSGSKSSGGR